jgi:hypothetical protein
VPLIRVIIAAREASTWIGETVASVAGQALPSGWHLEIDVGVDGCPETIEAVIRINTAGLHVFDFPSAPGPYVIFNSLAWARPADAFARFDSDDVMLQGYIGRQLQGIGDLKAKCLSQTYSIYVDHRLRPTRTVLADGSFTPYDGRRRVASHGQFIFTAPMWERLGAFQPWRCHADTEFVRRALCAGARRQVIPDFLYLRRVHPASLTLATLTGYGSAMRRRNEAYVLAREKGWKEGEPAPRLQPIVAGARMLTMVRAKC